MLNYTHTKNENRYKKKEFCFSVEHQIFDNPHGLVRYGLNNITSLVFIYFSLVDLTPLESTLNCVGFNNGKI